MPYVILLSHMVPSNDDLVWKALSSPVRRQILDALREGSQTTGDLADRFPDLSRYAVMQHLGVLVDAELVLVHREGRLRWNSLNVIPIQRIHQRWIQPYQALWASSLLELKRQAETSSRGFTKEKKR